MQVLLLSFYFLTFDVKCRELRGKIGAGNPMRYVKIRQNVAWKGQVTTCLIMYAQLGQIHSIYVWTVSSYLLVIFGTFYSFLACLGRYWIDGKYGSTKTAKKLFLKSSTKQTTRDYRLLSWYILWSDQSVSLRKSTLWRLFWWHSFRSSLFSKGRGTFI